MKNYSDDKINIIKRDIDKMRSRPTMYIGYLGDAGCLHLCKEIVDNNRDECLKKDSPGNSIMIAIHDDHIISSDNGRGIPTELLRVIHETNQAGSNMERAHGNTSGENGTGTTAYTAMASELIVTTYRPQEGKKLTLHYKEGELIEELEEEHKGDKRGVVTIFSPSKKILGVNKIPVEILLEWLDNFNYTLPNDITMRYVYKNETFTIKHHPLSEYFDKEISIENRLCDPFVFACSDELIETVQEKPYHRKFNIEAAIMYSSNDHKGEDIRKSWMNMIYTAQNGMHVNGVINGMSKYLTEKIVKKNKKYKNEDFRKDILSNLHVVVKATCNMANMFNGQAKGHVFPKQLLTSITNAVYEELGNMNQSKINDLVDVVIANNRVRVEGEKSRHVSSSSKGIKSWVKPASYIPCSSAKTVEPKELYLVEGLSAGGGIRQARNATYQAILQFRGKSLNVWDEDLDRVLTSRPWFDLVKVLGCGIGPSFDMKKLNFDKIIISTDADIDGYHIRVSMCSFFVKYMPEIIASGKMYIAEPPLYKLVNGKTSYYVASQTEYIQECISSIGDIKLMFPQNPNDADKNDVRTFIMEAFDYLNILTECSIELSVNRYLLEYIANGFVSYGENVEDFINSIDDWVRMLVKIYPEIGYDHTNRQVIATIDLVDQLVVIDEELIIALRHIISIQRKYGLLLNYSSTKRGFSNTTTIARFFEYIEDMYPVIKDRYKGLGSSPADVSREVIMNPKSRRIIKVTMNSVDIMKKMSMLVGTGNDNVSARKDMLMSFRFTKDMIDN